MHRFVRTSLMLVAACALAAGAEGCKKTVPPPITAKMSTAPGAKLSWGEVPLKGSVTRNITVTNSGEDRFLVAKVTVSPENSPFHSLFDKRDLAKGESLEIPVMFVADAAGPQTATLTIETDLAAIPKATITLEATVIPDLFCGPCTQPPRDACLSGKDLMLNERVGTCPDAQCQFERRVLECAAGCDFLKLSCNDVACPAGAAASVTSGNAGALDVAVAGTRWGYGMVWSAPKDGKKALTFALYGPDRKQRTDAPNPISKISGEAWAPALAFNGESFGLAYVGNKDGDEEIYATTMGIHGDAVRDPVRITEAAGSATTPAIAMGEGSRAEFGLAWADGRASKPGIYFARVSALDGAELSADTDLSQLPVEAHAATPALAWSGTSWLVAWSDNRDGDGSEIYVRQVTESGLPAGDPVRVTSASGDSLDPQLAWDGTRFLLAWADARGGKLALYTRHLKVDGTPDGEERALDLTSGNVTSLRMSLGTDLQAFAWIDDRLDGGGPGLYAAVQSEAHPTLEPQRLSRVDQLRSPAMAPSFGQFGVAFVGVQEPRTMPDVFLHTACVPTPPPDDPGTTP